LTVPESQQEIFEELAELEAQGRARRRNLARMIRLGALVVAASFLWLLRGDVRYYLQPKTPVQLGGPLEFNLAGEASQHYVRIRGVPGGQARLAHHFGKSIRMFGLLGSNVIVVQNVDRDEEPPAQNQAYSAQGRLVSADDAVELSNVFEIMEREGSVTRENGQMYALWDGQAPRQGVGLPLELLGIALFVLVNFRAAKRVSRPPAAFAEDEAEPFSAE
jgi:hypothetical protein